VEVLKPMTVGDLRRSLEGAADDFLVHLEVDDDTRRLVKVNVLTTYGLCVVLHGEEAD
jgi:hypothetical protein